MTRSTGDVRAAVNDNVITSSTWIGLATPPRTSSPALMSAAPATAPPAMASSRLYQSTPAIDPHHARSVLNHPTWSGEPYSRRRSRRDIPETVRVLEPIGSGLAKGKVVTVVTDC